ncbi:MAG: response regulator [Acidobacteriota bacterium]
MRFRGFFNSELRSGQVSLRRALGVPFVVLLALVAATGALSVRYGRQAVDEVSRELRVELTRHTRDFLLDYLATPHRINRANALALGLGELDPRDPQALERRFYRQLDEHTSFIFFGTPHGGLASAGRRGDGTPVVAATDLDPALGLVRGTHHEYVADRHGRRLEPFASSPGFDASERPWYRSAVEQGRPVWSPIYPLFVEQKSLAIAASQPVWSEAGELLGAVGVDLRLSGISDFLASHEVGKTGESFIVDRQGQLVATSSREDSPARDDEAGRRRAEDSQIVLVAAAAGALTEDIGNLQWIRDELQLDFELEGERQFVQVTPLGDPWGLDWLIVTVVPRADFMTPLEVSKRRTIALCLVALLIATLFGLQTSRWIAQPILHLSDAAKTVADGWLAQRLEVRGVRELRDLSRSFNRMTGQLRQAFDELETRVQERTAELEEAKEAAVAGSRAKSQFLANLSHEIRTPLAAILGYADLLHADACPTGANGASQAEAALYLSAIRHQGSHLDQLLRDLLDLSRIEAGRLELDPQPCELAALLDELVAVFEPQARERGLSLSIETATWLPWQFVADAVRVRQILSNLLSNAIKYTEEGRIVLRVGSAHPREPSDSRPADRPRPAESELSLVVSDTGVGISAADQKRLFHRFTQLERPSPAPVERSATGPTPTGTRRPQGFGLGLAITRQLAELMGGTVSLQSALGSGSSFRVDLPLRGCEGWARRDWVAPQTAGIFLPELQPLSGRVLIAEDSRSLQLLCERMLERWGLVCETADHGREAVECVRQGSFDIILMDWQMPEMDGLEATRELRRLGCCTPIVALTAAAMFGDRERCLQAGCDRYLVKPIDFKELHRLLGKILGQLDNTTQILLPRSATPPPEILDRPPQEGPSAFERQALPLAELKASPKEGRKAAADAGSGELVLDEDDELAALVRGFVKTLPEKITRLRRTLAAGDWTVFDALVHKLVGTAGTYGLTEIFLAAETLEDDGREREAGRARRSLERLTKAVERAVAWASEGHRPSPSPPICQP